MKKYKVIKDLPWMSKGTVFWIDEKTGWLATKGMILAAECYEATKNYFFEEGFEDNDWIIEIK